MLEENLAVPFNTSLLGVEVTVEGIDLNDADEIVAICKRGAEDEQKAAQGLSSHIEFGIIMLG